MTNASYLNTSGDCDSKLNIFSWFIQKVNHDIGGFSRVYLTHFRGFIGHIWRVRSDHLREHFGHILKLPNIKFIPFLALQIPLLSMTKKVKFHYNFRAILGNEHIRSENGNFKEQHNASCTPQIVNKTLLYGNNHIQHANNSIHN